MYKLTDTNNIQMVTTTNTQTLSLPHPVYTTNTLMMLNADHMAGKTPSL